MATAGELLAKMIARNQAAESISQMQKEFEEQSKRQLGGYCTEFSTETKIKESEE